MRILDRWLRLSDRLSQWGIWFGGALVLAAAALVSVDVLLRKLLGVTLGGSDELSGYAFAIGTAWSLGFTLLRRANVRVDAVYARLPVRLCRLLDVLALTALGLFMAVLTRRAIDVLADSILFSAHATTPLATPLWIPQSLWVGGLVCFLFTLAPLVLRTALALATGDVATVRALAGARTIEEDAAEETSLPAELALHDDAAAGATSGR